MQQVSVPAGYDIPADATVLDTISRFREEDPGREMMRRITPQGWQSVSAKQFADQVDAVAKGLIASGVATGDRVGLLSSTRYEWTLFDYAVWRAGATTVCIYETSAPDQVDWILQDSEASLLVVETLGHRAQHAPVIETSKVTETLVIDEGAVTTLVERGADVPDSELAARRATITAASPATLIYTSGTTGRPKGVALSHGNFYGEVHSVLDGLADVFVAGSSTLLFLPLAHVFARAVAVGAIESKTVLAHTSDVTTLLPTFAEFQPSFILSVPRVFEKVYNSAKQKADDAGKGSIFDKAAATAVEYSKSLDDGGPGLALKLKHKAFDVLVYSKLRAALGGHCTHAVSGGAPLGERLAHFFRGIGVPVFEGYGLTETTAAVTVNTPTSTRIGTVGRPVSGAAVGIADDGEVLLKGTMVFEGYWKNEAATADAIKDGWFHTGDIGSLDSDGFLRITGRKKELIVTAGGKNVSPAALEDSIRAHALVSQCLVVGDAKPFIAALVTLDAEALPGWLERHQLPADTPVADLIDNATLRAEIDAAVTAANSRVSAAERIKKFAILDTDFTIESGELTPTLKLKRNIIHSGHAEAIENLYVK